MKTFERKVKTHVGYVGIIAVFIYLIIISVVVGGNPAFRENKLISTLANASLFVVMFFVVFIAGLITKNNFIGSYDYKRFLSAKEFGIIVAITFATFLAFFPITQLVTSLFEWMGADLSKYAKEDNFEWYSILITVILAPVCEEILFRAFFARTQKGRGYIFATFLSAFVFAVFHGSIVQFTYQLLSGIVLALTYFITRKIASSILLHIFNNGFVVLSGYIAKVIFSKVNTGSSGSNANTALLDGEGAKIAIAVVKDLGGIIFTIIGILVLIYLFRQLLKEQLIKRGYNNIEVPEPRYIASMFKSRNNFRQAIKRYDMLIAICDEEYKIGPEGKPIFDKLRAEDLGLMVLMLTPLIISWIVSTVNLFIKA